ncbi:DNA mismatch repair endonuclease MutL [Fusobacterium russii]|uniref:DNA mismatch repair endonuclease MutL n=1 Tax=Fusobacterium russii TaxID=854 RepID=UPI0003A5BD03|nr:DNA mismatch repair endonuclease MutL [Fusobacterium russii]
MAVIKILDESVSNAIAAGEVVENPTSMIKELIENSLDAKSSEIKIEVKNGGLDLSITDNGCGMVKEDLLLSIERHATSKISKKEDLFKINTYGFRGEALSSISSVSKMILASRTKDMESAIQINVLGGKVTNLKEISKNVGTYIEIKDLFYNTPARLKFLRKESTEYLNIKDIVMKEALSNPEVKFLLTLDGRESIRTSGNGIDNAILEIFGKNYLKNSEKFSLGYLGNAELFKSNRDSIFTFINGRAVKSKLIEDAIIDAYHTKLMKGKYPFAIIFLNINPADIDVNVHPSKKIVKFANNAEIYSLVKNEVSAAFINDEEFISARIQEKEEKESFTEPENKLIENDEVSNSNLLDINTFKKELSNENQEYNKLSQLASIDRDEYKNMAEFSSKINEDKLLIEPDIKNNFEIKEEFENEILEKKEEAPKEKYIFKREEINKGKVFDDFSSLKNINFRVIGQLFDSFILVERNSMFEIYDQHIIHERILYEKLKQEFYNKTITKQNLLVPIRVNLDPREKQLVLDNLETFSLFGFEIDDFDKNEILIRTTPVMDLRDSYENILRNILENILKNKDEDIRENIIVSMSCKGAIKANHKLNMEEMYSMVSKLHEVGEYTCPHGRPIIVKLSLYDLERLFKRK